MLNLAGLRTADGRAARVFEARCAAGEEESCGFAALGVLDAGEESKRSIVEELAGLLA